LVGTWSSDSIVLVRVDLYAPVTLRRKNSFCSVTRALHVALPLSATAASDVMADAAYVMMLRITAL